MDELIKLIDHWQTLIGSILGGAFALATALIVASSAVRTARRTAATLISVDLLSICAANNLKSVAEKDGIEEEKFPLWLSEKLNFRRPKLSSNFDAYAAALVGVHDGLSVHLNLLKMIYSSLEEHLARIEQDVENRRDSGSGRIPRPVEATIADAKVVAKGLKLSGAHAECAIYLLDKLVLGRTPILITKIRMRVCPTPIEDKSKKLLSEGKAPE